MKSAGLLVRVVAAAFFLGGIASSAAACTGIRIQTKDGAVIYARTLEFAVNLVSNVAVVPRGFEAVGTAPGDKPGMAWRTKYAAVGANAENLPVIIDGLNEKGLASGIFYFPGYVKYQEVGQGDAGKAVAPWELTSYLLGCCADVPQAVAAARNVLVAAVVEKHLGGVPPCHYIVHDAAGRCAVLECVEGKLVVHDNPLGVITNSPSFDWHLTNLCNYINLSPANVPPRTLSGMRISGLGQGSGMLGLPGDFTPPSRFVRAVAFTQSAVPVETAREGVLQAFHILNQFDIPKGTAKETTRDGDTYDYTPWTAASDLRNLRYYFHTFENRRIRMVDLKQMDPDAKRVKTILDERRRGDRGPLRRGEAAVSEAAASRNSFRFPRGKCKQSPSPSGRGPG